MSSGRQRDEVGTELIRAAQGEKNQASKLEDRFMCEIAAKSMSCFYAKGWISFQNVAAEPAYESAQPRYPITRDVTENSLRTMPPRELMRTWRMQGTFGNLPKGMRHLRSGRDRSKTLPISRSMVDFDAEIQSYFHSYLLGWEPGLILVTLFEGNQPEPITAIVECENRTMLRNGKQVYQPRLTLCRA